MAAYISIHTLIDIVVWYLALRYVYEKWTTKKTNKHRHNVRQSDSYVFKK
ncbi:hypothetical protein PGA94_09555 [Pediococcus pentosaceus]|nr:hypothetical protein [Pediococcus pentosaceus]MDB1563018.1 hypothetical protein [Pediococcus pentosaceus]